MNDLLSASDITATKQHATQIVRMVRETHDQEKTAAMLGISTYEVGDLCGTAKHPDRKRNVYFYETAQKIITNYDKNKGKKIKVEHNPDTAKKVWDKVPARRDVSNV
jgi:hypothetical protein